MGTLSSDVDVLVALRSEENALLGWLRSRRRHVLWLNIRGTTLIANGPWVDRKCTVNISAGLIELNRLPSILGSLTDTWSILNSRHVWTRTCIVCLLRIRWLSCLIVALWMRRYVPFYLILAKAQGQIEFERIVLAALRLLETRLIWRSRSRASIGGSSWVGRIVLVWRTISRCSGCWREERSLSSGLVGRLIHFVLDISRFPDRISQLDYKVIIEVVFIGWLRLFSNSRSDDFTFDAFSPVRSGSRWGNRWRWSIWEPVFAFKLNCVGITAGLWHLWATLTFLLSSNATHFNGFGRFFLRIYLHRLVEFFIDDFPCGRFYIFKLDWLGLLGCSLRVEPFTFLITVIRLRRERFAHVLVSLLLLVDEMIGSRDVIVSVSFEASDRVLFFKLKVANEPAKKFLSVRHLLETREKAWFTDFCTEFFLCWPHVGMVSNFRDADTGIRVGV